MRHGAALRCLPVLLAAPRAGGLRGAAAPAPSCEAAAGRWGARTGPARRIALVFRGEIFRAEENDEAVVGRDLGYHLHRFTCTPEALERHKEYIAADHFAFIAELEGLGYAVDVLGTSYHCNGPRTFTPSYSVDRAISEIYGDRLRKLTMNRVQNGTQQGGLQTAARMVLDYSAEHDVAYDYVFIMRWMHTREAGSWGCNMKNNMNAFEWPVNNCELGDGGSCDVFHAIPRKFFPCFEEFLRTVPVGDDDACCMGCRQDCMDCMGNFRKHVYHIDVPGDAQNSTKVPICIRDAKSVRAKHYVNIPKDDEEWLNTESDKDCPDGPPRRHANPY
ncbi:unnamed protein product [Prorocentrum cordatum]|uniref:Phospholipase B-like n=1 Tax=Prorocentrum cordatum TaxID=2364126 RepID=A0ABN9S9W7_9DINO|nr:unnamed protein product [Polarella glacialis]